MSHHRGTLNEFGGVLEEVGAEIGHLVDVVVNAITHHGGGVPWVQRALALIPDAIKHSQHGPALAAAITELATAVSKAEAHRSKNQVFTDADVKAVSAAAAKLAALVPSIDLSVGALDTPDERVETLLFDSANLLARVGAGRPLHEGFYDPVSNVWHNWSLELAVYPNEYRAPEPPTLPAAATAAGGSEPATARTPSGHLKSDVYAPVVAAVESSFAVRTVGAGHSFNGGPSLGGSREQRAGTLVSLDHYNRVTPLEASVVEQRFAWLGAERAARVCHIEAGARLRDVTRRLWDLGLAFACQGSTDAQSIGGLISSDLHGTGNQHAFLSEALIELTLVTGAGRIVTLTRQSDAGHWRTDEASPRELRWLPAAGAIGMLGIVVDCLAVLVPRYNLEVQFTYMARREVEAQLAALVASNDHVSFYYPGGVPLSRIETVRMHRWSVTDKHPTWLAPTLHLISELSDHVVAAFAPNIFFDAVGEHGIATDPLTKALNDLQQPLVLPAPVAYPRKLYYRHDEDEWAVPFDRFLPALHAVLVRPRSATGLLLPARSFVHSPESRPSLERVLALLCDRICSPKPS